MNKKILLSLLALPLGLSACQTMVEQQEEGSKKFHISRSAVPTAQRFGGWTVNGCSLEFYTTDFTLRTTPARKSRVLTFTLSSNTPVQERPQLTFNTSDYLIRLEGSDPLYRFDIPFNSTLLPQLYQDGSYLILTYLPEGSRTFAQHFFPTKDAINGLQYLVNSTCG